MQYHDIRLEEISKEEITRRGRYYYSPASLKALPPPVS